jgi:uncharacterized protein YPO0396
MVTSDLVDLNQGLFTYDFQNKYDEQIRELFESLTQDQLNSNGAMNKFTDYRTYMDYDIRITNGDGDSMTYSKVFKEKSGGETQTPFYIVMASCFDELMNKDSNKVESTCQVVFDEAFNNMDESRIKSLMEFYKNLNIQVIIIVPSNRISAISPYMDTMIGIAKINNHPQIITSEKI